MKAFIFLTREGYTYQPQSESVDSDIENLQVIGFGKGDSAASAFTQLLTDDAWLTDTSFREVFSLELAYEDFESRAQFFALASESRD